MKLTYLSSFLILLLYLFAPNSKQIANKKNKTDYSTLSKEFKKLNYADTLSFEQYKSHFYRFLSKIKLHQNNDGFRITNDTSKMKRLYALTINKLMGSVLVNTGQYDSIINYYYPLLNKTTTEPYLLGRAEIMYTHALKQKNRPLDALLSIRRSIDYFNKSKHKYAKDYEINMLTELASFYLFYNKLDYKEKTINILEQKSKENPENKILFFEVQMIKSKLLLEKGNIEESLKILNAIDVSTIKNKMRLYCYYNQYLILNLYHKNIKKAAFYFNKIYEDPVFERQNIFKEFYLEKMQVLFSILILNKDFKKAASYIHKVKKDTLNKNYVENSFLKLFSEYYKDVGEYKQAYTYQNKYYSIRDFIEKINFKLANDIITDDLLKDKNVELIKRQKKSELILLEKEKKISTLSLSTILAIVLLFGYILYNKRKKEQAILQLKLQKSKEIIAYKNAFLENISHEIRTSITVITGYLYLINENTLNYNKIVEYTKHTIKSSTNLITTFNNFLTLIQLEQNEMPLKIVQTKILYSFFKDSVADFIGNATLKNINLYFKSNLQNNIAIDYNFDDLEKIISNLLNNALKYSSQNTKIYCSFLLVDCVLKIKIKDEGFGIAEDEQLHIFSRFYQSKNNMVIGGFGIGLSLVKELVHKLEGTIKLQSEPDKGSVFTINLPLELEGKNDLYLSEELVKYELLNEVKKDPKGIIEDLPKILIVDDNIEMIRYFKDLFYKTIACDVAFNGLEGLEKAKQQQYDVILSDLRMPLMDGIRFKQELNKIEGAKKTPFIMITAVTYDLVNDLKLTLGLDDYIVKPFSKDEILQRIQLLLEKSIYPKQIRSLNDSTTEFSGSYSDLMQKINEIIRKNLTDSKFSGKILAKEVGYTSQKLNKILQSELGLTATNLIIEVRLLHTYDAILKYTNRSVSEVMFDSGWNTRPYFYKKFVARFGINPGELRKKVSNENINF